MAVALWIIAVCMWLLLNCEVVRLLQNAHQLKMLRHDTASRDNAYAEFVKSLKDSDAQFVRKILEEFERQEGNGHEDH